jgi:hypothetical protein
MNEKINEIAEQAGFIVGNDKICTMKQDNTIEFKKFVELLEKEFEAKHFSAGYIAGHSDGIIETVQECIDIISMSKTSEELLHPIQEIKQRFGVE